MNYLRKFRNRFACNIELVSALEEETFLISPPNGFTDEDVRVNYNGVYFTISSAVLQQESKQNSAGTFWNIGLSFSFPTFPGFVDFLQKFTKLAEIRVTMNTGAVIRLNKNDISLNKPIDVNFKTNQKTVEFEAQFLSVFPFNIDE